MEELKISEDNTSIRIFFDREYKKNSLTPDMLNRLADQVLALSETDQVKTLVIQGVGDQFFSSGYDISHIPLAEEMSAKTFALQKPLDRATQAIESFPYTSIAVLNGSTYGGACEIAFSCDLRYAADHIKLCMPPAKIGLIYSVEGLMKIGKAVGYSNLKRMVLTAEAFDADDLISMGAIDRVLPFDQLNPVVNQLIERTAQLSPLSLKGHKEILTILQQHSLDQEDLKHCQTLIEASYLSQDVKEGRSAFLEKRKPVFKGL